jgi:membrane-associated PAP2 superfamily phosphatase
VSENLFRALVKIILIAISLKLLLWDGVRVLAGWH